MREASVPRAAALLLMAAPTLFAASHVPTRLLQARYVVLGYDLGDRFLSESDAIGHTDRISPEDRRALDAVRDLVEKWDRYVITPRLASAQLVIAVRAGRRMQAGIRMGRPGDRPNTSGVGIELSSNEDMLSVYDGASEAGFGTLLWRGQRADGFRTPSPALVEQFKTDVEAAGRKP
jgi:hypothetical protein